MSKENSGSPVFCQSDMASVEIHVLGGNPNSASVIFGPYDNPFDAYVAALKAKSTESHDKVGTTVDGKRTDWLSWVTLPTRKSISNNGADEINGADETNGTDEANRTDESNQTGNEGPDEAMGDTEATIPTDQPESKNGLDFSSRRPY
jgi:hypothetical protein